MARAYALVVASTVSLVLFGTSPTAQATDPACPPATSTVAIEDIPADANVLQCDMVGVTVTDGEMAAVIPGPGQAVEAIGEGVETTSTLSIEVADSGILDFDAETVPTEGVAAGAGSYTGDEPEDPNYFEDPTMLAARLPECSFENDRYVTLKNASGNPIWIRNHGVWEWRLNEDAVPNALILSNVRDAIRQGINHAFNGFTNCNMTGGLGNLGPYRAELIGATTRTTDIRSHEFGCLDSDGINVVGFGDLPAGKLAVACIFSNGSDIESADMRFNKVDYGWLAQAGDDCKAKYEIRSLATHEAGHWLGLADLSANAHYYLTMYGGATPCQSHKYTLGRGDIRGLHWLYDG